MKFVEFLLLKNNKKQKIHIGDDFEYYLLKKGLIKIKEIIYKGNLRNNLIELPKIIDSCAGIRIFGKLIKSLVFSTDIAIIRNTNADAVIAVYPFTPQPIISEALISSSSIPVFCGVGGGLTTGTRVVHLASNAEFQGAFGVVLNAPTKNEVISMVREIIDIPIVITVVKEDDDIEGRIKAGANILNVSAASRTPYIIEKIKKDHPEIAIIATGGPTEQSIKDTVNAGANAVTYTPPTSAEVFKNIMTKYRENGEVSK